MTTESAAPIHHVVPFVGKRVLRDVLQSWGIAPQFYSNMSALWECELCDGVWPHCQAPERSAEECLERLLDERVPVVLPSQYAKHVHAAVEGGDALQFFTSSELNTFPKPRIAFKSGWAGPDTFMDEDEYCALVSSFEDVLTSPDVLNLQLFHRPELSYLPVLVEKLQYSDPIEPLMSERHGALGVVCDRATRMSRKDALTWWHLDDGGEYVYQCSLPLSSQLRKTELVGPNGLPVTKIFVYAEGGEDTYRVVFHDAECNRTGKCVVLDLFQTPSEGLPPREKLPVLKLAVLEAGGGPLLSPPNLPHLVITVQDCVMVERRTISLLNIADVLFFERKAQTWATQPIVYPFLKEVLPDRSRIVRDVLPKLIPFLDNESPCIRRHALRSVRVLLTDVEQREKEEPATTVVLDASERRTSSSTLSESLYAVVYYRGRPVFGPARSCAEDVERDVREMNRAVVASATHKTFRDPEAPIWKLLRGWKGI